MKILIESERRILPNGDELVFIKYMSRNRVVIIHRWKTGNQMVIIETEVYNSLGKPCEQRVNKFWLN